MERKPYRVLFIDDDKVDQLAFKRLLAEQKLPYESTIAGSVAEAKEALRTREFDIVIADYRLGDGTAFDLIDEVRFTPMVFVTGSGSEEVAIRAMRVGAADYLVKDRERNYLKVLPATVERALSRLRAEQQVHKLTKAVEESPVAVMITDREGHIEYVNPRFEAVTGYSAREAMSKTPRVLKSGAHEPEFYRRMWGTILAGKVWRGELQNRRRDGTIFWESLSISPLRSPGGDITHFVAIFEDVTDRKRAEEMLRQSEENFRALADNASDGILISAEGAGHSYANRRAEEITGRTRDELLKRHFWELAPLFEQERLRDIHARRIQGQPAPEVYSSCVLRPDGTEVPVEVTVARTVWHGQPALMSVVRDIGERIRAEQSVRESEEKYRTLVEHANFGIAIIQDGLIKYINPWLARLAGWDEGEIINRPFVEYIRPDERQKVIRQYQRRMRGEEVPAVYETVFRRRDGSSVYAEVSAGIITHNGRPADFVAVHDLTQHHQVQLALADREARLSRLVNQVPAVFWTTDRELRFTSSVGAGLARLNLVPGEVVGRHLSEFFRTDDPEALPIASHRRALNGEHVVYVMEWNGNAYDTDVEPLYDEQGSIVGTIGVALDITTLVNAEKALQESEENFRLLAANAGDGIVISSAAGRALYVNPHAAAVTGYAPDQLLGLDLGTLAAHPRDAARLRETADEVLRGQPGRTPLEVRLRRPDGSHLPVEFETALTTWRGQPAIMHLIRDITHRKRHEAALREERDRAQSYLDIAGGIILALDRKGQISLINLPGAELLGYAPAELIGRDWYNTCVPESERAARRAAFRDATARRARPQPSVQFSENTVLTRDGRELTIAWHDTAIRGERGETTGMLSSGYDVTQRKQAEADREKLILELDAYAHTVAHDLSGPLTAVMGFTDLLKTNPALAENADARENLLHIEASASRMKNIIEELLKLAGVRKADVELEPVDMSQVVLAALERLTFMIQEHKPEVVLPEVWPAAIGHAPWVEEVWVNYFSNAMKYGGRPPRIELGAKVLNASFVLFWVQDNGPGLDDDQRRRLFTEFTRMHQSTASGQGLGLSIVRRIMEKLGGDVWLESQPGRGSRFGFILPAVPPGPR